MVDTGTNLYTLQTEFGLTERVSETGSAVFTTARWAQQATALSNPAGLKKILGLMRRLAGVTLDKPIRQGWIKYPMRYTGGVVELRTEGMRAYGKVIGKDNRGRTVVVFDTAEDKDFNDETDSGLTEQAAKTAQTIADRWTVLKTAQAVGAPNSDIANLDAYRKKRKR